MVYFFWPKFRYQCKEAAARLNAGTGKRDSDSDFPIPIAGSTRGFPLLAIG